jgi:hypothetical protein
MSMESLSIFCNDFDFFLQWFIVFIVEFFHFLCLVILMYSIFGNIVNRIISYILSQFVTYWYTETLLIFVNWICPTTLLKLFMMSMIFWWSFLDLLGIRSCHRQTGVSSLLPFLFEHLLFSLPFYNSSYKFQEYIEYERKEWRPLSCSSLEGKWFQFFPI